MRKLITLGLLAAMTGVFVLGLAALPAAPVQIAEANPGTQWNATYFDNATLSGSPKVTRVDDRIDFNWVAGSPDASIPSDNFSARWTKTVNFPTSGKWTFRVGADDGIRVWVDVTQIVNEWHGNPEGYRTYEVSIDALTAGNHDLKVEYYEASGNAGVKVDWWFGASGGGGVPQASGTVYGAANWNASYFNNNSLSGSPVLTRTDGDINFDWGAGSPDASKVPADNFSVRWTTTFNFPTPGTWRFQVGADDGIRVWIDVTQIINEWHGNAEGYKTYQVDLQSLTAGNHELKVEYYDSTGNAKVQVRWLQPGAGGAAAPTAVPTATPIPPATVFAAATGTTVNVRSGPGLGNPVVGTLVYARNYRVLAAVPDLSWLQIDIGGGRTAWVSNEWVWLFAKEPDKNKDTTGGGQPDFVDDIPRVFDIQIAPPAEPVQGAVIKTLPGIITDTVNFRDGPSAYASNIIGSIPGGSPVQVEARNGNGAWYLVNYRDIRGWVSALYVTLSGGTANDLVASSEVVPVPPPGSVFVPETAAGVPAVTVRGRANSNLNLRDAASLRGNEIGSIPANAEFVIEGRNSNGAWYLLTYDGQPGWINAAYVTLTAGTVSDLPIR
jgi:uncharacterized protein YgiM (DUF1202 family)